MQKILVSGANGFVGKAVCAELAARGLPVQAAVRSAARIGGQGTQLITPVGVGNIDGVTDWTAALAGCSAVIHLAARAHILRDNAGDPCTEFRKTNVDGTMQLARSAAAAGVRRFIFVSSVGVNGQRNSRPFTEADPPDPGEPYAVSKLEAEIALRAETEASGMELVIVRPPLVYGPDCPGNFRRLLKLLASGLPLPLAAVVQQRSYIGVWNLADFLVACLLQKPAAGEMFLISDGEDIALPGLLRGLAEGMQRKTRLFPVNPRVLGAIAGAAGAGAVFEKLCGGLTVDASHARQVLGWQAPVSLAEGLRRTGNWYAQQR